MTDSTKDNRNDGGKEQKKRGGKLKSFLLFVLTLVLVLAVVVIAAYRDGTGFDVLRRYFNYGRAEQSAEAGYDYDASPQNHFVALGDTLVIMSDTSLQVQRRGGDVMWETALRMEAPALVSGGGRAVAYDVGGTELYILDENGLVDQLTVDEEEPLIAVTLNEQAWMAVTAKKENYKACVSVYNAELEKMFDFNSSRRFASDAYVTDDCKFVAAVTLGQENSVFVSEVVLYDLTQTDPVANYGVADGLVLQIGQQGEYLTAVADNKLTMAGTDGTVKGEYGYGAAFLREYDLGGDGYTVLLLNRYQSGNVGRLITVGTDGTELASLEVNDEVRSLSAAGRYIAVLYTDSLVVYNQDLQTYATLKGTGYAKAALVRNDGSALLISAESARLFLP